MKNIIVDVKMHFPMLAKCIENVEYWSSSSLGYLSKQDFFNLYGFEYKDFYEDQDLLDEYENFYFVHHFVDINTPQTRWMDAHQQANLDKDGNGLELKIIKPIYDMVKAKIKEKVIFFCSSDHPKLDLDNNNEYSFVEKYGLKYDVLFKKEYNRLATYSNKTHPCPFYVMGSPDVLWMVNESQIDNQDRDDLIFWSGSLDDTKYDYQLVNISRPHYVNNFDKITSYSYLGSNRGGLRDHNYLIEMSKHKYAIYLAGWATFTRRFFEILSTNTLMFFENVNIEFNLNGFLHPLCVFNNLEELKENYNKINSSMSLYQECLNQQKYLLKKYFNYKSVGDYINLNTPKD